MLLTKTKSISTRFSHGKFTGSVVRKQRATKAAASGEMELWEKTSKLKALRLFKCPDNKVKR